ncbi:ABC-2 type transport system ATP-binding protein [Leucobacter exalbidus]|uniref:ABC-2 type transport system ATP-binding protein n=1 Tax=Leucobacter exalbidus TaxID=662960 RepID=A0A940PUX0_9MICO|nr:ABC transporter ATP-binding protein [Leucobacter exalbidus]MBP1326675.1 ABC-2 type transport system ATP-binding protein [Leucobacter exalbidus]
MDNSSGAHGTSAVRVSGLTKTYGTQQVLRGVDLDIAVGETYALLGPNGAGKSTTIEVFEGIRRGDTGSVRVLGVDPLTAPRQWRSRVGIVAQSTGDLGPFTPRELIGYFGSLATAPRGVDEVLELVGLTAHAGKRAAKLSGGQQRRLDVALGIVGRPEVLFLDEPTTGFDPEARHQFWDMIAGLSAEGTSILLTTHYLDEAAQLADRVGVLSGGRIVAEATPELLGGAEARVPVVRWRDVNGDWCEERTEQPGELVGRLCAEARTAGLAGGEPEGLEVRRPSLEDIYLGLIAADETERAAAEAQR